MGPLSMVTGRGYVIMSNHNDPIFISILQNNISFPKNVISSLSQGLLYTKWDILSVNLLLQNAIKTLILHT